MKRNTLLGLLMVVLATTAVTSTSAAQRYEALALVVRPSVTALHRPVTVHVTNSDGDASQGWTAYEPVTVQFKECGLRPSRFRNAAQVGPTPGQGANWSASITPAANGTVRATIGPYTTSNEVRILTRPQVRLAQTRSGSSRAEVDARVSFRGKPVRIERHDRGRWTALRAVVLSRAEEVFIDGVRYVRSRSDGFALEVPAGTKVRAVLPQAQAKPCYVAGYSRVLQR
jgi:hypothetical protein